MIAVVAREVLRGPKPRDTSWVIRRNPPGPTTDSKNTSHPAGTSQNRRTIMTAGLAIRALATNNRRRSVARAKLTVIYAAPGFLRKGLKRADRFYAAASHTVKSYRAGVRGSGKVAACC